MIDLFIFSRFLFRILTEEDNFDDRNVLNKFLKGFNLLERVYFFFIYLSYNKMTFLCQLFFNFEKTCPIWSLFVPWRASTASASPTMLST